jgi:hypothetical protein
MIIVVVISRKTKYLKGDFFILHVALAGYCQREVFVETNGCFELHQGVVVLYLAAEGAILISW